MGGVFAGLVVSGGGRGGWSVCRFCSFGEEGVVVGVFADFVASGRVEYLQILWLWEGEVVAGVFADFVAS